MGVTNHQYKLRPINAHTLRKMRQPILLSLLFVATFYEPSQIPDDAWVGQGWLSNFHSILADSPNIRQSHYPTL